MWMYTLFYFEENFHQPGLIWQHISTRFLIFMILYCHNFSSWHVCSNYTFIWQTRVHTTYILSCAHTVILPDWTLKKWGLSNFAFQQAALLGIHRHPMQKEFLKSCEGLLRAALTLTVHGHPCSAWKIAKMAFLIRAWSLKFCLAKWLDLMCY